MNEVLKTKGCFKKTRLNILKLCMHQTATKERNLWVKYGKHDGHKQVHTLENHRFIDNSKCRAWENIGKYTQLFWGGNWTGWFFLGGKVDGHDQQLVFQVPLLFNRVDCFPQSQIECWWSFFHLNFGPALF